MNLRGKFTTDEDGRFWFATVKMIGYPIPTGGVVGRMLQAQNRHPYRPAHLHALIVKEGFKVLISQVYDPKDLHIDTDPQFGVTKALLGDYTLHEERHPTDPSPGRRGILSITLTSWSRAKRNCLWPQSSKVVLRLTKPLIRPGIG